MSLPVLLHSGMTGAPQATFANGTITSLLTACLVNGFNTQSVSSAAASGGVVAFNFPSAPGFDALDTVTIAGASNATVNGQFRVQSAASNQVLVSIPGVPDGAVAGTITMKFSPLGWTRPYSGTNIAAYRQGGGESFFRYLRVRDSAYTTDSGGSRFRARGYESMSAISTGTNPFPTVAQVAGDGTEQIGPQVTGSTANADPRPWIIVGTPRAFYLSIGHSYDNGGVPANGLQNPNLTLLPDNTSCFFFGDIANKIKAGDTYHTIIQASYGQPACTGQGGSYIARKSTGVAGAVASSSASPTGGISGLTAGATYPSAANSGLTLFGPASVYEQDIGVYTMRGMMPGMMCSFEKPGSAMYVGTILSSIAGITGRVVMMAGDQGYNNANFFLLLDEDWGDV